MILCRPLSSHVSGTRLVLSPVATTRKEETGYAQFIGDFTLSPVSPVSPDVCTHTCRYARTLRAEVYEIYVVTSDSGDESHQRKLNQSFVYVTSSAQPLARIMHNLGRDRRPASQEPTIAS